MPISRASRFCSQTPARRNRRAHPPSRIEGPLPCRRPPRAPWMSTGRPGTSAWVRRSSRQSARMRSITAGGAPMPTCPSRTGAREGQRAGPAGRCTRSPGSTGGFPAGLTPEEVAPCRKARAPSDREDEACSTNPSVTCALCDPTIRWKRTANVTGGGPTSGSTGNGMPPSGIGCRFAGDGSRRGGWSAPCRPGRPRVSKTPWQKRWRVGTADRRLHHPTQTLLRRLRTGLRRHLRQRDRPGFPLPARRARRFVDAPSADALPAAHEAGVDQAGTVDPLRVAGGHVVRMRVHSAGSRASIGDRLPAPRRAAVGDHRRLAAADPHPRAGHRAVSLLPASDQPQLRHTPFRSVSLSDRLPILPTSGWTHHE